MILRKGPKADKGQKVSDDEKTRSDVLVAKAQNGDDDAFSSLVGIYEMFVYNTACRELSSSGFPVTEAEDIAQTAFMKAWRNLSSFRGDCQFSSWLYRITVNAAQDTIRTKLRHPTQPLVSEDDDSEEEITVDVPVTEGDDIPEENLERRETIKAVRAAVESLPDEQRKIIVLRDFNDMPYDEIASMLGIEMGTVKSRLFRARAALKEKLRDFVTV